MAWRHVKVLLVITLCLANCQDEITSEITPKKLIPKPDVYELHVNTNIENRYAKTEVSSRVVNPADEAQEVGFTVILPESAFITGFLMEIKGKVYDAYVKEKEEAKKTYDEAVSQGLGAAYVEQNARDSNQFTVSVNIEPHDKVNFNLTYEELLSRTLGTYNHVININPGQIVQNLTVVVNIKESSNITKVEVPKLQIDNEVIPDNSPNPLAVIGWKNSQTVTVRYEPTPTQQKEIAKDGINGQLTVKYDVDRENSQQILVNGGYFVHFFAPESLQPLPKHVVFVLDYSGSMIGRKIEQLKEAMMTILTDLSSQDYFSLVLFSTDSSSWAPAAAEESTTEAVTEASTYYYGYWYNRRPRTELGNNHIVPVTPGNIQAAKDQVNTYSDYGSTNIIAGLRDALRLTEIGSELLKNNVVPPEPMIIFLTDGQPNVELSNPDEIVKEVKRLNTKRVPIFSLAFGYGADFKFLRKLSLNNNGFARNIYEAADAAIQLKNFYKEVSSPLLSNITFTYSDNQVDNDTSTRHRFPIFYYGSEIVVAGKLVPQENEKADSIDAGRLTGRGKEGEEIFPIIIPRPWPCPPVRPIPEQNQTIGPLEKVWAYLTIQQLLDKIDTLSEAEVNGTKTKALNLALKYKFVTSLTSLVVVKPNETKAVNAEQVRPSNDAGSSAQFYNSGLSLASGSIQSPLFSVMKALPSYNAHGFTASTVNFLATTPQITAGTIPKEKIQLEDLKWISNYTSSDNSTVTLPLSTGDRVFNLGHKQLDDNYGSCQLPNTNDIGECRHLEYCALREFQDDVTSFLPYQCDITNGYLGTCCPV